MKKIWLVIVAAVFVVCWGTVAFAKGRNVQKSSDKVKQEEQSVQIQELNDEVKQLKGRVDALQESQVTLADEFMRRTYIGAYANFRYIDRQNELNHFDGNRLDLVLDSRFHDRIRAYVDVKFLQTAGIAADNWQTQTISTGNRGGSISLLESYADFMITKWLNFRGGIFLVPYIEYNRNPYMVNKHFADDPMEIYEYADAGAELFGSVNVTGNVKFSYELGTVQGIRPFAAGLFPPYSSDNNKAKSVFGRFLFDFKNQYKLNVAGYYGDYTADGKVAYEFDGYIKLAPKDIKIIDHFELFAEYMYIHFQDDGAGVLSAEYNNVYSLNSYIVCKFWPKFLNKMFLGKYFDDPTLTLGFRYFRIYSSYHNPLLSDEYSNMYAIAFGYRPIQNFVMHVQYEFDESNGTASVAVPNPGANTFMVNMAYSF